GTSPGQGTLSTENTTTSQRSGASTDDLSSTQVLTLTSHQSKVELLTVLGVPDQPRELCKRLNATVLTTIFPSPPESACWAANSSTLIARSTPLTGSRGRGSRTTSQRIGPSQPGRDALPCRDAVAAAFSCRD
ncbi:hypothetical protein Taro_032037, partial [Colocasia esculenta]|nr:hypothetical protein [Colocasia esculenta]